MLFKYSVMSAVWALNNVDGIADSCMISKWSKVSAVAPEKAVELREVIGLLYRLNVVRLVSDAKYPAGMLVMEFPETSRNVVVDGTSHGRAVNAVVNEVQ